VEWSQITCTCTYRSIHVLWPQRPPAQVRTDAGEGLVVLGAADLEDVAPDGQPVEEERVAGVLRRARLDEGERLGLRHLGCFVCAGVLGVHREFGVSIRPAGWLQFGNTVVVGLAIDRVGAAGSTCIITHQITHINHTITHTQTHRQARTCTPTTGGSSAEPFPAATMAWLKSDMSVTCSAVVIVVV
jgi:hypothetical protein